MDIEPLLYILRRLAVLENVVCVGGGGGGGCVRACVRACVHARV